MAHDGVNPPPPDAIAACVAFRDTNEVDTSKVPTKKTKMKMLTPSPRRLLRMFSYRLSGHVKLENIRD
jgi:hypothetical protein